MGTAWCSSATSETKKCCLKIKVLNLMLQLRSLGLVEIGIRPFCKPLSAMNPKTLGRKNRYAFAFNNDATKA